MTAPSTLLGHPARAIGVSVAGALALLLLLGAGAPSSTKAARSLAPLAGTAVSTHDPFGADDCAACHASADANAPGPVADASSALCLSCHDDPAPDATHRHGGVAGRCTDCHNPHNAMAEKLLHAPTAQLCTSCHDAVAPAGKKKHAPLTAAASCVGCHAPHGAGARLLAAELAPGFYAPYRRDAYALCFGCHEAALVEAATTTTATRFRDGARNLHTVHVMRDKGRTCRACHDAHAADTTALVPDSVPFGTHGWRLPLSFRPTPVGGSCAKTCHVERGYDRGTIEAASALAPAAPTVAPSPVTTSEPQETP